MSRERVSRRAWRHLLSGSVESEALVALKESLRTVWSGQSRPVGGVFGHRVTVTVRMMLFREQRFERWPAKWTFGFKLSGQRRAEPGF